MSFDPKRHDTHAQAYFEEMKPRFIAHPWTRKSVSLDFSDVSTVLLKVAKAIDELDMQPRLQLIDPALFDHTIVARIVPYAWSLEYINVKKMTEAAARNKKLITEPVATAAMALRAKMLRVVEYYLSTDPRYRQELPSIREGTGYEDLLMDLSRLCLIYSAEHEVISQDRTNYHPSQLAESHRLIVELKKQLGRGRDQPWATMGVRAFSVIEREYWHLRKTVEWAWREEPEVIARFPTIFVRAPKTRKDSDKGRKDQQARAAEGPVPAPPAPPVPVAHGEPAPVTIPPAANPPGPVENGAP